MSVLTPARSGLARSGATRSGYPIAQGVVEPLYCLSGVARSGATRSNYHSSQVFVAINGVQYAGARLTAGQKVLDGSLSITDLLNETPNTAAFSVEGFIPTEGQSVVMTLGSINNADRLFAGQLLNVKRYYVGTPSLVRADVNAIDPTWGLNAHKVTAQFVAQTLGAIATAIFSAYAPAGYTLVVDADIAATVIDVITFTEVDFTVAITNLTTRAGGDWRCDYDSVVRLFFEDTSGTAPTPLRFVSPLLLAETFRETRDLSQIVTRANVQGGGSVAFAPCVAGETIIPVETIAWYLAAGGTVIINAQRVTYTGLQTGAGGSLVGPGAAPVGAPTLALASGAGIESGSHDYAITFVTAAGQTIPGPRATIVVGLVAAPAAAPTAGSCTIGTGPDPGTHTYAITFVTASGETTVGPTVVKATELTADPSTAPTPAIIVGTGVDDGDHDYAVTFVTSIGETLPSPISGLVEAHAVTSGLIAAPSAAPAVGTGTAGGDDSDATGQRRYAVTFLNAAGETTLGPDILVNTVEVGQPGGAGLLTPTTGGSMPTGTFYYLISYVTAAGETRAQVINSVVLTGVQNAVTLIGLDTSPNPLVTGRKVYRYDPTDGSFPSASKLVKTFTDNTTTTFTDTLATAARGASIPTVSTACYHTLPLSSIPLGGSGTTKRRIYRSKASSVGGTKYLVGTINDNTTTTFSDTVYQDASLGAAAPSSNTTSSTAHYNQVSLTSIPKGDANVTSRKLYRRSGGAGLKLVTTIANNTATTYTDSTANASLGAAAPTVSTAYLQRIPLSAIPTGSALVTSRKIYRTVAGGSQLKLVATLADNTSTTFSDTVTDASLGANAPGSNTATANQVALSAIPLGPTGTTQRKLYRTVVGGSTLKLVTTIADNTTTTATDSTADGSLGASAPGSDTSGLTQPAGVVLAGSTSLPCASIGDFAATGGWCVIGNGQQVVRYTGISGNTLTGIPATGTGAIAATIAYNSSATPAPALTGVPASGAGALGFTMARGDAVNLYVQVNDAAAQAALAALIGGTGVQEGYIQDGRLSATECVARGTALLAQQKDVLVTAEWDARDINTRSGRTASINLGSPFNLVADLLVQQVTITHFFPKLNPTYHAQASSVRFTFDDLLRMARHAAALTPGAGGNG